MCEFRLTNLGIELTSCWDDPRLRIAMCHRNDDE